MIKKRPTNKAHEPTLGDKIHKHRLKQGKSLRYVAKEADISVQYLSNIEDGSSSPTIDVLEKLARVLNVTTLRLFQPVNIPIEGVFKEFLERYRDDYPELLESEWLRCLVSCCVYGREPNTKSEWLMLFLTIRTILSKELACD